MISFRKGGRWNLNRGLGYNPFVEVSPVINKKIPILAPPQQKLGIFKIRGGGTQKGKFIKWGPLSNYSNGVTLPGSDSKNPRII